MVYSQLVRYPHGPEQKHPADFSIVPDLAEKWEHKSPTVIEFTLRKGVRFHNKPPVNGREVTAEDAKYSIERFMAKSGSPSRPSSTTSRPRRTWPSCRERWRRSSRTSTGRKR
jgi:ABC-type transport system substrate-binding protein